MVWLHSKSDHGLGSFGHIIVVLPGGGGGGGRGGGRGGGGGGGGARASDTQHSFYPDRQMFQLEVVKR